MDCVACRQLHLEEARFEVGLGGSDCSIQVPKFELVEVDVRQTTQPHPAQGLGNEAAHTPQSNDADARAYKLLLCKLAPHTHGRDLTGGHGRTGLIRVVRGREVRAHYADRLDRPALVGMRRPPNPEPAAPRSVQSPRQPDERQAGAAEHGAREPVALGDDIVMAHSLPAAMRVPVQERDTAALGDLGQHPPQVLR